MFAYCLNNPVNYVDYSGKIAVETITLIVALIGTSAISGAANALSTEINGGSRENVLCAAGIGALGGAAGFGVAWLTGFSSLGALGGRATATVISDLGTSWAINGELSEDDFIQTGVDVVLDVCYSAVGYYYTVPIKSDLVENLVNAGMDGLVDIMETYLFFGTSSSVHNPSGAAGRTHGGAGRNVMLLQ